MATLSERELEYLGTQRLGRLATLAPDGYPQNNPVGFFYNAELGTIDIGGHKLGDTRKFGNVRTHPKATLVVDDLASVQPWHVRGVEIRGDVEADRHEVEGRIVIGLPPTVAEIVTREVVPA